MNRLLFVSSLIALPIGASAQQHDASRWGIGAGAAAIDRPYAGEDIMFALELQRRSDAAGWKAAARLWKVREELSGTQFPTRLAD